MTDTDRSKPTPIRPRVRDAILQSLRAGVVPRTGLEHVQVGRVREVEALLQDIVRIADGGSSVRFVIGAYGSGKTFFLHLVRAMALEKRLVTCHADLTPDRRLQGSGGQARGLYAELTRNLATRSKPEGGALASLVERFVTSARQEAGERDVPVQAIIDERCARLSELVGGYDFAQVIGAYWRGHEEGDPTLAQSAVRWLRGEISTKTEARELLGVRGIVEDATVWEHLKLLARFCRLAGYDGLVVCLDEMVNLYKLANARARRANYERLLAIVNDGLQGTAEGLGYVFGGTPEFLTDPRRGLFSYEALQSRLAENRFATDGRVDFSGPVLRLSSLTPEEVYLLLVNIVHVAAGGDPERRLLPDEAIEAFLAHCNDVVGAAYFRTPRATIKAFTSLLAVLEQNPDADWRELIGATALEEERNADLAPLDDGGDDRGDDRGGDGADDGAGRGGRGDDAGELRSFRL